MSSEKTPIENSWKIAGEKGTNNSNNEPNPNNNEGAKKMQVFLFFFNFELQIFKKSPSPVTDRIK